MKNIKWIMIAIAIVVAWFLLSQLVAAVSIATWLFAVFLRHWMVAGFLAAAVYCVYWVIKR